MWITANFQLDGVASSGLSPIIRVRDMETGVIVASGTMSELGEGFYAFDFLEYDIEREYVILCDSVTLPDQNRYKSFATGQYGNTINTLDLVSDEIDFRMNLVKKIWQNRLDLQDGDTLNLIIYDDDSTTELIKWAATDLLNDEIIQETYSTSKRTRGT